METFILEMRKFPNGRNAFHFQLFKKNSHRRFSHGSFDALRSLEGFKAVEASAGVTEKKQSKPLGTFALVWVDRKGENVFTEKLLQKIRSVENKMMADVDFSKTCIFIPNTTTCSKPFSAAFSLGFFNETNGNILDVSSQLSILSSSQSLAGGGAFFFDKTFSKTNQKSQITRSVFTFGGPLEGFKNVADEKTKREQIMTKLKGIAERWDAILRGFRNDTGKASDADCKILKKKWMICSFVSQCKLSTQGLTSPIRKLTISSLVM